MLNIYKLTILFVWAVNKISSTNTLAIELWAYSVTIRCPFKPIYYHYKQLGHLNVTKYPKNNYSSKDTKPRKVRQILFVNKTKFIDKQLIITSLTKINTEMVPQYLFKLDLIS